MEGGSRRGEEEDMELPNNNYNINNNNNNINHHPLVKMRRQLESTTQVVKLPLAPIISTPRVRPDHDRIIRSGGNAAPTVSTRRGSSIFSPNQTLDHQMNNLIPPPPPPQIVQKEPTPDPDPNPNPNQNPVTPPADTIIMYKECLKNHAANIGGHVVDGCGEFMPSGDEGTPEALRCNACNCHRSFHRKQDNPQQQSHNFYANNQHQHQFAAGQLCRSSPSSSQQNQNHYINFKKTVESSSEDLMDSMKRKKKRFRTKFSKEQKERMSDFAEKLEWRMQKKDEDEIQEFCNEVGVKREVFKVFMHNCKQATKKIRQTSHH